MAVPVVFQLKFPWNVSHRPRDLYEDNVTLLGNLRKERRHYWQGEDIPATVSPNWRVAAVAPSSRVMVTVPD